jgi:hypothetical protein
MIRSWPLSHPGGELGLAYLPVCRHRETYRACGLYGIGAVGEQPHATHRDEGSCCHRLSEQKDPSLISWQVSEPHYSVSPESGPQLTPQWPHGSFSSISPL